MEVKITINIEGYGEASFDKWLPLELEDYPDFVLALNHIGDLTIAFLEEWGKKAYLPFKYTEWGN